MIGAVLASGAVILGGWEVGAQHAATVATPSTTPRSTGAAATPVPQSSAGATASASAPASTGAADGTYPGSLVDTPYGTVKVSVTIRGGAISDVTALKLTDDGGRSVRISRDAAPILRSEVLKAQSANVDSVSGATFTTDGYLTSLQAALDSAHFG